MFWDSVKKKNLANQRLPTIPDKIRKHNLKKTKLIFGYEYRDILKEISEFWDNINFEQINKPRNIW